MRKVLQMNDKKGHALLCFLTLVFFLSACHTRPSYVLNKKEMKDVTRDIVLADAYLSNNYRSDSLARLLYESIFDRHKISRAQYDSSFIWYAKEASQLSVIYEELNQELADKAAHLEVLYQDSLRDNRFHFIGLEALGYLFTRIELPFDSRYLTWSADISPADTIHANDTLRYAMILTSALREGERILFTTRIKSEINTDKILWIDTLTSYVQTGNRHSFDHIIPPSYQPTDISVRVTITSKDSTMSLFPRLIDSLRIDVHKKVEEMMTDPIDSLEDIAAKPEVIDEMDESINDNDTTP